MTNPNVYSVLFERALEVHNPFLCPLCSDGAQERCPINRAIVARARLKALADEHAAETGGYYLMCPCDYCRGQVLKGQFEHELACKHVDGSACANHAIAGCHCDCRK